MEPTEIFRPFGSEGPKVMLFGKETGDWNPSRLQNARTNDPGLYFRLGQLGERFGFQKLLMPNPTECNTLVVVEKDFTTAICNGYGSLHVKRGVMADGVVLPRDSAGAIASADCPTIIAYCPMVKVVVVGHGGFKSLVDTCHGLNGHTPRVPVSIVDSIVGAMKTYGFLDPQVFVTCGIRSYERRDLSDHVRQSYPEAVRGNVISLHDLAVSQFVERGVKGVMTDTIDTMSDSEGGDYKWHSHRRGQTPQDKAGRNLVLVVNK